MNKEKRNALLIRIGVIAAILLVVGLAVYNQLYTSGAMQRAKTALKTDNYSVDGVMFSYFYVEQYQNMSQLYSYFGVDTSKSLKTQPCSFVTDGGSWFDYITKITRDNVGKLLTLCEIAREKGLSLDESDRESIDSQIESIKSAAQMYGIGVNAYLKNIMLNNPLTVKDVKKCLELTTLAGKGNEYVMNSFEYTDEDFDTYASENAESLEGVDCCAYTFYSTNFRTTDADENPTSTAEEESAAAEEAANKLAAAKTADEYDAALREILTGLGQDAEGIEHSIKDSHLTHASYANLGDEAGEWAKTASVGDTKVVGETGSTSFSAYLLTRAAYRDESKTRNVRHILFLNTSYQDDSKPREVYAEWEASGFSEDKFVELCKQYTEDPGSKDNGGLYENVSPGQMIEEFDEWLFDAARKPGDHDLIESEQYGWHIMYYVGEGDKLAWKVTAENAMKSADYDEYLQNRAEHVTFYESVMSQING